MHYVLVVRLSLLKQYPCLINTDLVLKFVLQNLLNSVLILVQVWPRKQTDAFCLSVRFSLHDFFDLVVQ